MEIIKGNPTQSYEINQFQIKQRRHMRKNGFTELKWKLLRYPIRNYRTTMQVKGAVPEIIQAKQLNRYI